VFLQKEAPVPACLPLHRPNHARPKAVRNLIQEASSICEGGKQSLHDYLHPRNAEGMTRSQTIGTKKIAMNNEPQTNTPAQELRAFLFLTVVMAPVLAVMIVGGYGFFVWMYQLFTGTLPSG
jgi:periplasmic nitrate reductase NapE